MSAFTLDARLFCLSRALAGRVGHLVGSLERGPRPVPALWGAVGIVGNLWQLARRRQRILSLDQTALDPVPQRGRGMLHR